VASGARTFGSFIAQEASRTWYCGVRLATQGDVPAPPSELCEPGRQQRGFAREQGTVAPCVASPPQQKSVPTPGHGSPCFFRQVSAGGDTPKETPSSANSCRGVSSAIYMMVQILQIA
jgi:hypothetical protein